MASKEIAKAPALILDNVLKAVEGKGAGDWRWIGGELHIPWSKLDEIKRRHVSDEECLKAVLDYWLKIDPSPSWKRLIVALDETVGANDGVRDYADLEPMKAPPRPLTPPDVTAEPETPPMEPDFNSPIMMYEMMAECEDWFGHGGLGERLNIPRRKVEEFKKYYFTNPVKAKRDMLQYWLDTHPAPSWDLVAEALYQMGKHDALRRVQEFRAKLSRKT